jgi:hypothetical protein
MPIGFMLEVTVHGLTNLGLVDAVRAGELACTLDGEPAVIAGLENPFPSVRRCSGGELVEFSWSAVRRVLAKGGAFRS